jgi:hypothetical protein
MGTMPRALTIGTVAVALATIPGTTTAGHRDAGSSSDPCAPSAVASVITEFFTAFNRGDAHGAVQVMDPQAVPWNSRPRGWFALDETDSRGPGRFHSFYSRAALARYFADRHRHHERLRLLTVIVGASRGSADIVFRVRRRADDLVAIGIEKNRTLATGKGEVLCARRKIFIWSMGHGDELVTGPKCPGNVQACRRRR